GALRPAPRQAPNQIVILGSRRSVQGDASSDGVDPVVRRERGRIHIVVQRAAFEQAHGALAEHTADIHPVTS
ncbi:MAG TPA: hypothetical protein VHN80_28600, partial [Kineosporiaceae bacterium]|nr:hypothetical protein [Kineosporiaceae bacterium]